MLFFEFDSSPRHYPVATANTDDAEGIPGPLTKVRFNRHIHGYVQEPNKDNVSV